MSSISKRDNDGFDRSEFHKDRNGQWVIGIRALGRMAGVHHTALLKALRGGDFSPSKLAKSLLAQGFCPGDLEDWAKAGVPERAVPVILSHYAFDANKRSELAKQVLVALTAVGIHAYLDEVVGDPKPAPVARKTRPPAEVTATLMEDPVDARRQLAEHEKAVFGALARGDNGEPLHGFPVKLVQMAKIGVTQGLNGTTPDALNRMVQERTGKKSARASDYADPLQNSLKAIALNVCAVVLESSGMAEKLTPQQARELGEGCAEPMVKVCSIIDPSRVVRPYSRPPRVEYRFGDQTRALTATKAKREQEKRQVRLEAQKQQPLLPGL